MLSICVVWQIIKEELVKHLNIIRTFKNWDIFSIVLFIEQHKCSVRMAMTPIQCLPNELLMKIFSYLHVSDVSIIVAKVCRRWNEIWSETYLWSGLVFIVEKETNLKTVLSLLPHLPYLRNITLNWRTDTDEIVKVLCKNCYYLEKVNFFSCGHVKGDCVKQISKSCRILNDFSLGKCYAVQNKCLDDIPMFRNLTCLNLSHNTLSSQQFLAISASCAKIHSLNIDYVRGISEADLTAFITTRIIQLKSLIVFGEMLTDNIFNCVEICENLKTLHISTCRRLSEKCFVSINKMKNLKSLTLRKLDKVSSIYLYSLLIKSDFNKHFTYLYISSNRTFTEEELLMWCSIEAGASSLTCSISLSITTGTYLLVIKKDYISC